MLLIAQRLPEGTHHILDYGALAHARKFPERTRSLFAHGGIGNPHRLFCVSGRIGDAGLGESLGAQSTGVAVAAGIALQVGPVA